MQQDWVAAEAELGVAVAHKWAGVIAATLKATGKPVPRAVYESMTASPV